MIWGRGANLFSPDDGGYQLVLPLGANQFDTLRAGGTIDRVKFGPFSKPIYAPLAERFEREGWVRGNLAEPAADETLFFFTYDWRYDNSVAATTLASQLEQLARSRRNTTANPLPVSLLCQSNGAHICRYLLKYGAASLEQAEGGRIEPLQGVVIDQMTLVAAANGGMRRSRRCKTSTARLYAFISGLRSTCFQSSAISG